MRAYNKTQAGIFVRKLIRQPNWKKGLRAIGKTCKLDLNRVEKEFTPSVVFNDMDRVDHKSVI